MSKYGWATMVLLGLAAAGCNTPCQTYCQTLTDHIAVCVENEAVTQQGEVWDWGQLGAASADDYYSRCMTQWESALQIARAEDRNEIYDWCTTANTQVVIQQDCEASIALPEYPDFMDEDVAEDETIP